MKAFAFLNIDIPWIAWLVYRGEMISSSAVRGALSVWHTKYLIDLAQAGPRRKYYESEYDIEVIRQDLFPTKVSRLSGL